MKILVIGKTGQVGKALIDIAQVKGLDVCGVGRDEADIIDKKSIEEIIIREKPTVVINTSAFHVVAECESKPEDAFLINAAAVKHLADICKEQKIRLVHFSTDKVFDGDSKTPYSELDRPNPLQIYGISKLAGEECALYYNQDTIIIRTAGIFGGRKGSRAKKGNFVLYILREAKDKNRLEISSEQTVSVTYAADLADATLDLIQRKVKKGIYNVVNDEFCTWADFAQEIIRVSKKSLEIVPVDRKGYVGGMKVSKYTVLSTEKIKSLGLKLPSWKDGVRRYIEFLSHNE